MSLLTSLTCTCITCVLYLCVRLRKARKVLEPTRCARRFHRYCDTDASRSLSQQEWLLCVGVNRDDSELPTPWCVTSRRPSPVPRAHSALLFCVICWMLRLSFVVFFAQLNLLVLVPAVICFKF